MTITIQAARCVDCDELHPVADLVDCNGDPRCEDCAKANDWAVCDDCCDWFCSDDLADCNGEHYCESCADSNGWFQCHDCNEWTSSDEQFCGADNNSYCAPCFDDKYVFCHGCDEATRRDDIVDCDGEYRCMSCAMDAGWFECDGCNTWFCQDSRYATPDGEDNCESCFYDAYSFCDGCSEPFDRDALSHSESDGCDYCDHCRPSGEDFDFSGFRNTDGRTTCIGSERCFGVELETDDCGGYDDLDHGMTMKGSGAWGAKYDATCDGKEFYSDILSGDAGLAAIAELTDLAARNRWYAGSSCGYHLHLDMRAENDDSLYAVAYAYCATEELWHSCVKASRRDSSYARIVRWTCADLDSYVGEDTRFIDFVSRKANNRYIWINLAAYHKFTTIEVRLHHASLDDAEICNWIKAHARFVDWATTIGYTAVKEKLGGKTSDEQFEIIASEAWQDDDLRNYYAEKSGRAIKAAVAA